MSSDENRDDLDFSDDGDPSLGEGGVDNTTVATDETDESQAKSGKKPIQPKAGKSLQKGGKKTKKRVPIKGTVPSFLSKAKKARAKSKLGETSDKGVDKLPDPPNPFGSRMVKQQPQVQLSTDDASFLADISEEPGVKNAFTLLPYEQQKKAIQAGEDAVAAFAPQPGEEYDLKAIRHKAVAEHIMFLQADMLRSLKSNQAKLSEQHKLITNERDELALIASGATAIINTAKTLDLSQEALLARLVEAVESKQQAPTANPTKINWPPEITSLEKSETNGWIIEFHKLNLGTFQHVPQDVLMNEIQWCEACIASKDASDIAKEQAGLKKRVVYRELGVRSGETKEAKIKHLQEQLKLARKPSDGITYDGLGIVENAYHVSSLQQRLEALQAANKDLREMRISENYTEIASLALRAQEALARSLASVTTFTSEHKSFATDTNARCEGLRQFFMTCNGLVRNVRQSCKGTGLVLDEPTVIRTVINRIDPNCSVGKWCYNKYTAMDPPPKWTWAEFQAQTLKAFAPVDAALRESNMWLRYDLKEAKGNVETFHEEFKIFSSRMNQEIICKNCECRNKVELPETLKIARYRDALASCDKLYKFIQGHKPESLSKDMDFTSNKARSMSTSNTALIVSTTEVCRLCQGKGHNASVCRLKTGKGNKSKGTGNANTPDTSKNLDFGNSKVTKWFKNQRQVHKRFRQKHPARYVRDEAASVKASIAALESFAAAQEINLGKGWKSSKRKQGQSQPSYSKKAAKQAGSKPRPVAVLKAGEADEDQSSDDGVASDDTYSPSE